MLIVATTASAVKLHAIESIFRPTKIISYSTAEAPLPAQPINSGRACCYQRIDFVKAVHDLSAIPYDYIVSIENGIETIEYFAKGGDYAHFVDLCYVVLEDAAGNRREAESYPIPIAMHFINQARAATTTDYKYADLGLEVTAGAMIHQANPDIPADDWMADPRFFGRSRLHQIEAALYQIRPALF